MLIVLFIVVIIIAILLLLLSTWADDHDHEFTSMLSCCGILASGFAEVIIIIAVVYNIVGLSDLKVADKKIAMYEEENESIERSIEITVKRYMDYEASTYQKLKEEEAINLVPLIPELKSDALVQKQITIYVANNDKIKELKEEKIDLSKAKWQLYFGR